MNNSLKTLKEKKLLFAPWAAEDKFYASHQCWYNTFKKLFSQVINFDPSKNLSIYGMVNMNKKFLEVIEKEQPDFIFFWLIGDEFNIETLLKIKEISPKTKTINFFGDDDILFDNFSRFYSLLFDYYIMIPEISLEIYKKEKIKNIFSIMGIEKETYKPLNLKKDYDVSFIGFPRSNRYDLIKYIKDNNIKIRLYGKSWQDYPEFKDIYFGPVDNKELIEIICKTKINLCFSRNHYNQLHVKGRVFEILGCKSFLLAEYSPKLSEIFKDKREIIFFKDKEDLIKKIRYYLKHEKEREKIAKNGYKRVLKDYDLVKGFSKFFSKILKNKNLNKSFLELINTNKKVQVISKEEIKKPLEDIKKLIKNFDYITFTKGNPISKPYRNNLQVYSLEKTKKEISCCDYKIYSKKLGNLLSFPFSATLIHLLGEDFYQLLDINQLMVTKNFFIRNIEEFRKMFRGETSKIVKEKNTAFISIPLVSIDYFKKCNYSLMKKAYSMDFLFNIHSRIFNKKLFSDSYIIKLILESLQGKIFILRFLIEEKIMNRYYLQRLLRILFKNEGFYKK